VPRAQRRLLMPEIDEKNWVPQAPTPTGWYIAWFFLITVGTAVDLFMLLAIIVALIAGGPIAGLIVLIVWLFLTWAWWEAVFQTWPWRIAYTTYHNEEGQIARRPMTRRINGRLFVKVTRPTSRLSLKETWLPAEKFGWQESSVIDNDGSPEIP